jgi:pimeloyl-ACP methyl ester carboxylesterase
VTEVALFPPAAMPPGTSADATEVRQYTGHGGRRLEFRVVAAPRARHTLLYLHGIESHGGWFLPAAQRLRERGCTTYLLDRRGSGLNRSVEPGDAASAEVLLDDVRRVRDALGDPLLHLVGLSWGGKLATAAALDRPERVASLVLVTPGLRARVDLGWLQKLGVGLDMLRGGRRRFPVPLRDELFTNEPALRAFLANDPLRTTSVTSRFLWATRMLDRRIARGIAGVRVPVLLLLADDDLIVDNDAVLRLLAPLPEGHFHVRRHAHAMHSIQLERTDDMVSDIVSFLEGAASPW